MKRLVLGPGPGGSSRVARSRGWPGRSRRRNWRRPRSRDPPATAKNGDGFPLTVTISNTGKRDRKARRARLSRARAQTTSRGSRRATASGSAPVPSATSRSRPWSGSRSRPRATTWSPASSAAGTRGNDRCRAAAGKLDGRGPAARRPEFTPGARTLDDPLLPQIGNGGYDARHYEIELDYDPVANSFDAATTTMHRGRDSEPVASSASTSRTCRSTRCASTAPPPASAQVDGDARRSPAVGDPADEARRRPGGRDPRTAPSSRSRSPTTATPQVFADPDGSIEGWIPSRAARAPPQPATLLRRRRADGLPERGFRRTTTRPTRRASTPRSPSRPARPRSASASSSAEVANGDGTTTWRWREDDPDGDLPDHGDGGDSPIYEEAVDRRDARPAGRCRSTTRSTPRATVPQLAAIDALAERRRRAMIDFARRPTTAPIRSTRYGSVWRPRNPSVGYALEVQTKSHFSSASRRAPVDQHQHLPARARAPVVRQRGHARALERPLVQRGLGQCSRSGSSTSR